MNTGRFEIEWHASQVSYLRITRNVDVVCGGGKAYWEIDSFVDELKAGRYIKRDGEEMKHRNAENLAIKVLSAQS